jgi:hypothetical protein
MNNLPAPIEVEAKAEETALIRLPQAPPPAAFNLFGASSPAEVIQRASDVATQLKAVVSRQGLISKISNREYPRCEAWTLLGTIVGVFPVLCWTRKVEGGWEARVEARLASGAIVGAAEAECLKSEKNWASRDDFALRSMAQTRATAKALRMPLGFVMTLAGYEATPAEEMVADHPKPVKAALPAIKPAKTGTPKVMSDADYLTLTLKRIEEAGHLEILPEYLEACGIILPNENLADWPDKYVPHTKEEMGYLLTQLQGFANGDPAVKPFPAREGPAPKPAEPPKTAPIAAPQKPGRTGEWWRDVVVPIPHKGQKRADYMANPETIGRLYDVRHGNSEEDQASRQRLWGFIEHYEPKGWVKRDGTPMPPSDGDLVFREALDALGEHIERNGEKL